LKRRDLLSIIMAAAILPVPIWGRQVRSGGTSRIVVDPRIELMSIVHLLGGYFLNSEADTAYRRDANAYFDTFRSHPVVGMAMDLAKKTFSFDNVPGLLLRLTNPHSLIWRKDLEADAIAGIPDAEERERFLFLLRDFASVSRFEVFFNRNRRLYRQVALSIEPLVTPNVDALETYTGASLGRWRVIPGMLSLDGGFGPKLRQRSGILETYAIIGPLYNSAERPNFGDYGRLQDLIVHEFAHSLINPLSEQHRDLVQGFSARFDAALRAAMLRQGAYDNWQTVVDEHVVRAVTARVAAKTRGTNAGAAAVLKEVERGFVYVPALIERLDVYEADRRAWPDLNAYYPNLLRAFDERITVLQHWGQANA
jgi:Domain of unknown function (DUF4932)